MNIRRMVARIRMSDGGGMRKIWTFILLFGVLALAGCAGTMSNSAGALHVPATDSIAQKQEAELRHSLLRTDDVMVERCGDLGVALQFHCDTLFESNSARIRPSAVKELHEIAEVLKKYPDSKIVIDVHTDCLRSEEENLTTSDDQAAAVKDVLTSNGVQSARINARGWGESKPVASNATEDGRHANRRAMLTITN